MRSFLSFALMLYVGLFVTVSAQTGIRHQGVLRDNGALYQNQTISVQYMIRQGGPMGTMVYNETANLSTNDYGLFSHTVGSITPAQFDMIDWSQGDFYLEVVVNGTNLGTTQLSKVPTAYYADKAQDAQNAQQVGNIANHNLADLGNVDPTAPAAGEVLKWNGTEWRPGADSTGSGSLWNQFGSRIYYDGGNVGIGTTNPQVNFEVKSDYETSRLARIRLDSIGAGNQTDMLEMYGPPSSLSDDFQFIEFQRGGSTVARVNGDGSAEFKSVEFDDGTTQSTAARNIVAFGSVASNATPYSGSNSGNFSVSWNSSNNRYEITITGESYFFQNYTSMVTPISSSVRSFSTSSSGGKLLVYLRNSSGSLVQGIFQFMVIKPQ